MAPFPVDPSGGDGRGCARLGAGGTPALPGSHHRAGGTPALPGSLHPMTSSHQGHKIAEALGYCMWLKEVHLSSGLFVFEFVSIRGSSSSTTGRFSSNDPPRRGGRGLDSRANGSFPKGSGRLSEKSPARHPPPHQPSPGGSASATPPQGGSDCLGARASRPHAVPLATAELQCDAAGSHPVGGNSSGQAVGEPWRRSRLIQVGEMAEAVPGLVRAGRPRSQEAIIVRAGCPRSQEAIIP